MYCIIIIIINVFLYKNLSEYCIHVLSLFLLLLLVVVVEYYPFTVLVLSLLV
jgi:hypothetical protein